MKEDVKEYIKYMKFYIFYKHLLHQVISFFQGKENGQPVIETLAGLILSPSLGEEERPLVVWAVSSGGVGTLGGGGGGGGLTCLGELDVI